MFGEGVRDIIESLKCRTQNMKGSCWIFKKFCNAINGTDSVVICIMVEEQDSEKNRIEADYCSQDNGSAVFG